MTTDTRTTIDNLRTHANRHMLGLLDDLGVMYVDRGQLLQGPCPSENHGGDGNNPTAWSWRTDIGRWKCWTHACDEEHGSDIFGLIRSVLDVSFTDSVAWLTDHFSGEQIQNVIASREPGKTEIILHKPLTENLVRFLCPDKPPKYLLDRKFDPEVLRKYEVGFWHRVGHLMNDRVVIPVRDHTGALVGFTGRTVFEKAEWHRRGVRAKWIHGRHYDRATVSGEFTTSSLFFNFNNSKVYKSLIVVEGPLDGFKLEEAGIHNWIGTLGGSNFSLAHKKLLIDHGVQDLIIAFDPDEAGAKGASKIEHSVSDVMNIEIIQLPTDPGEMGIDEIKKYFAI